MSEDLTALAADAYVYGFPLVTNLREVKKFTRDGLGSLPPARSTASATRPPWPVPPNGSSPSTTTPSTRSHRPT